MGKALLGWNPCRNALFIEDPTVIGAAHRAFVLPRLAQLSVAVGADVQKGAWMTFFVQLQKQLSVAQAHAVMCLSFQLQSQTGK
ncbi:hypothetical protein SDC9_169149 [bioreactor metagenome]|uniref:Uncharacterized protein n=1 Tax=bioreactor metagenome TaxID=1076179 RepID=A0A645G7K3_9ZZZZ